MKNDAHMRTFWQYLDIAQVCWLLKVDDTYDSQPCIYNNCLIHLNWILVFTSWTKPATWDPYSTSWVFIYSVARLAVATPFLGVIKKLLIITVASSSPPTLHTSPLTPISTRPLQPYPHLTSSRICLKCNISKVRGWSSKYLLVKYFMVLQEWWNGQSIGPRMEHLGPRTQHAWRTIQNRGTRT